MKTMIAAGAVLALAGAAVADTNTSVFVNLANFSSFTGPGPIGGLNSETFITLGAGTQIVNIEFVDIEFDTFNGSWASELTVSVNDSDGVVFGDFWDSTIPGAPGAPGAFGPVSAPFENPGEFGSGPFTMAFDDLWINVYETFNDAGVEIDATILSGGILITYKPIPTPGSAALLGLAGLAAVRRRR